MKTKNQGIWNFLTWRSSKLNLVNLSHKGQCAVEDSIGWTCSLSTMTIGDSTYLIKKCPLTQLLLSFSNQIQCLIFS